MRLPDADQTKPLVAGRSHSPKSFSEQEVVDLLGVVRPKRDGFQALLDPPNDLRLETGDGVAVLAPSHKDAAPPETIPDAVELLQRPAHGNSI